MDTAEEVLAHFGIRGMKWGVRRQRGPSGTVGGPTAPDAARAKEVKSTVRKFGLSAASNEDLKLLNERVKLETKYHELFPNKPGTGRRMARVGAQLAQKILLEVGENQAKRYLNKQIGNQVDISPLLRSAAQKAVDKKP